MPMATYSVYFNKCRANNFGNVPTNKTPPEVEAVVRREYLEGSKMSAIAARNKMSWSTVNRICADLTRKMGAKLSDVEVTALLTGWRSNDENR